MRLSPTVTRSGRSCHDARRVPPELTATEGLGNLMHEGKGGWADAASTQSYPGVTDLRRPLVGSIPAAGVGGLLVWSPLGPARYRKRRSDQHPRRRTWCGSGSAAVGATDRRGMGDRHRRRRGRWRRCSRLAITTLDAPAIDATLVCARSPASEQVSLFDRSRDTPNDRESPGWGCNTTRVTAPTSRAPRFVSQSAEVSRPRRGSLACRRGERQLKRRR